VQFHDPKLAAAASCLRSGAIERMTKAARPVAHAAVYCSRVGLMAGGSNGPQRAARVVSRPPSTSGGGGSNLTALNRPLSPMSALTRITVSSQTWCQVRKVPPSAEVTAFIQSPHRADDNVVQRWRCTPQTGTVLSPCDPVQVATNYSTNSAAEGCGVALPTARRGSPNDRPWASVGSLPCR
jgi:hypothetical protein